MHVAIADKKEELAAVCRRYGVARLEVFGSAARGMDFDPQTSDADFLVEFDPDSGLAPFDQFFDLAEALSMTLGRPVDLVESGVINNPYLRAAIDRSRELVYASWPTCLADGYRPGGCGYRALHRRYGRRCLCRQRADAGRRLTLTSPSGFRGTAASSTSATC